MDKIARSHVRGRVLEFQDDDYATSIGGAKIECLDIIHKEPGNPRAGIIADLTQPTEIPGDLYDCIICTQVLHTVEPAETFLREIRRILKPGGVLLLAVPFLIMWGPENNDLIRWTPLGLRRLLSKVFESDTVEVLSYGNSLVAAADVRGFPSHYLTAAEKGFQDARFAVQICALAKKSTGEHER
jgi:SAM-dependent methyltransferase